MTRVDEVNFIRSLAGDIASAICPEEKTEPAQLGRDWVAWWLSQDDFPKPPDWWDKHDTALLEKWVIEELKGEIK